MILEGPLADLLEIQTSADNGTTWNASWFGQAQRVAISRGGSSSGISTSVEVGTLSVTLLNAGDPRTDTRIKPNVPIRVITLPDGDPSDPTFIPSAPLFTGRIADIGVRYELDKSDGSKRRYVVLTAVDAVRAHTNTTRYGAVTSGGVGYETWAARINRLAASSTEAINPPADDSPIVRYAI